ncbi:MAG: ROK family transcriptional regulator [Spirochaetales bacterium]|nr:ROK family transcriptional regulator [Spirochaetales bacterium]
MGYKVSDYFATHGGFRSRDIEKAKLYELIVSEKETSRKKLNQRLQLRPNNVSYAIQQLLDDGLIFEDSSQKTTGRGRPEVIIKPNPERLVTIVLWVLSNSLSAALIDMEGNRLWQFEESIASDADNTQFLNSVIKVVTELQYCVSKKQTLIGIGIALPGAISSNGMKWSFNSRWNRILNLDFSNLAMRFKVPVRLFRLLDPQLYALGAQNSSIADSSVLFVHWGYGIGATFSIHGEIPKSSTGSITEIGHVKVDRSENAKQCSCGDKGCLETVSSVRALKSELERIVGSEITEDENELGSILGNCNLSESEAIKTAIECLTDVLDSTYRILFSDKIMVYGPFLKNPWVARTFSESLRKKIPEFARSSVDIEIMTDNLDSLVATGCTYGFFRAKLQEMLVFYGSSNY